MIERIRQSKAGLIAEIQAAREVGELGELGELHFLCRNPAGEELPPAGDVHRETPTDAAPPVRATRWLIHFLEREPLEVWFAPAADHAEVLAAYKDAVAAEPVGALTCYRAIANERGIELRTPVRSESAARGCSTCRHRKRPGRANPGYCGGGRDDLPGAYGDHHPLRRLPADQGASCGLWRNVDD